MTNFKIFGIAKDDSDNPIAGVYVYAFQTLPVIYPCIGFKSNLTDVDGTYEIILPAPSGIVEYHVFAVKIDGTTVYGCTSMPYVQISG